MARFGVKEVHALAALAQLRLSDEEAADLANQLDEILDYAARIQALDTEGVPPTSHALLEAGLEGEARWREDSPRESIDRDEALESAPDGTEGLFKVPKVLP